MTQDCSLTSSTADANALDNKRLQKGIRVIGTDHASASGLEGMPLHQQAEDNAPWGYLHIQHFIAEKFDKTLQTIPLEGTFIPRCFIHRTVQYKQKPNGRGVVKKEKPTVSGLVFLQGNTKDLCQFLQKNFPFYHLVNNCSTGQPASISHQVMRPFMKLIEADPERVTFLRDPFIKFTRDHVKLRVLTGLFAGQEGYVVRINRDRQLVMDLGGYAVAIKDVHNEDFEVVE